MTGLLDDFDDYEVMQSGTWDKGRGAFRPLGPVLPKSIGSREICWCGLVRNHDWPGRADGEKHPRD